jgi:very-short-patch-repair endonuclease
VFPDGDPIAQRICAAAAEQAGVITRQQAHLLGMTDSAIGARVRNGRWRRLFPRVYVTYDGPIARATRCWAAVLHGGTCATLSHETAAELAGLASEPAGSIHITIPSRRFIDRQPGVVVHRSARVESTRHPSRTPPQTRIEETVVDLTQQACSIDEAVGWLDRACRKRLTTPGRLLATMGERGRLRWRAELTDALTEVSAGCQSELERRYYRRVERAHHLPIGERQARTDAGNGRRYDDVRYRQWRLIIELDGRVAHPSENRRYDQRRDNDSVLAGDRVLRFGWGDVMDHPCATAVKIATVLRLDGWRGKVRGCGPGCELNGRAGD